MKYLILFTSILSITVDGLRLRNDNLASDNIGNTADNINQSILRENL